MGKSFDYRKKMNNNRRIHIKGVRKIVLSSAVVSTLVFQPFIPVIENGKLVGFTEESASAATLAEVGILENIEIDAELGNLEGPGHYDLNFSLTGTGLADIELANPEAVALFSAPSLAGNIATAGPADVRVELLPVTMDDLPALGTLVTNLTGTLDTAVSGIVGSLDEILGLVPAGVLEVNGLEELQDAVDALNNVDVALADLLVYEDQVGAVINPNGSISVDFTSGLDEHLNTAVNEVVLELLNDVIVAAQGLEVNLLQAVPLVGPLVNELINGILSAVTETIVPTVQTAVDGIASGATDLTGELAAAQVIGFTQVNLPTTINRVPEVSGEVAISGAVVNTTNVIDVELLSTLPVETSVVIPELDTTAPIITPIADVTTIEEAPIAPILVESNEEGSIVVNDLPDGLTFDEASGLITGTPVVDDWGPTEEERDFTVEVTATDEAGNTDTEEFVITIQRDTDGDGDPDVTDPDDDNDGVPDGEEVDNGTDPKVDELAPVISPIEDATETEDEPIEAILIEVDESNDFTIDVTGLPEGLEYDSETESIVGTPTIEEWVGTEETREFETTVTATDEAGNTDTEEFVITIQRDTDGDGDPDVTDPDDDNDGVPDDDEVDNGTDPKDDTDTPDLEAPNAPEVDGVTSEDTEIVGSTEPGAEVTVTFPNGETATGTADEEGNFVVVIPEDIDLTGGEQLEVVAEDEAGNVSEVTPIEVGDATAPIILEIDDQTVTEGDPIEDIEITVENPGEQPTLAEGMAISLIMPLAAPLVDEAIVTGLPNGVTFDSDGNTISGVPVVDDWGVTEESRDFDVTVTARDEAGNEATEVFTITVQRDTDADGDPDVTDPDDDNDGATDEEENDNGTNPKVDDIAPVISPIEDVDAVENEPINDIVVDIDEPSEVVVDGLPNGLEYDPETGIISGTPVINDWAAGELEREYTVTITAEDEAGNTSTIEFVLVVQRDTDDDGTPDGSDSDDDNDGATDEEEIQAGTNPWDNTNYPGSGSGSANNTVKNQAMLPQTGESQSIFAVVSGLVLAAVSSAMLMFNKKKNSSNSSKRTIKK